MPSAERGERHEARGLESEFSSALSKEAVTRSDDCRPAQNLTVPSETVAQWPG